jgi:hypothetical protein
MRGSDTKLIEHCEYLVHRPEEPWEVRVKKDPRDLRILDPACGSGHFLLYCFDLLCVIYEEGWTDPNAPPSALTGRHCDKIIQVSKHCGAHYRDLSSDIISMASISTIAARRSPSSRSGCALNAHFEIMV